MDIPCSHFNAELFTSWSAVQGGTWGCVVGEVGVSMAGGGGLPLALGPASECPVSSGTRKRACPVVPHSSAGSRFIRSLGPLPSPRQQGQRPRPRVSVGVVMDELTPFARSGWLVHLRSGRFCAFGLLGRRSLSAWRGGLNGGRAPSLSLSGLRLASLAAKGRRCVSSARRRTTFRASPEHS